MTDQSLKVNIFAVLGHVESSQLGQTRVRVGAFIRTALDGTILSSTRALSLRAIGRFNLRYITIPLNIESIQFGPTRVCVFTFVGPTNGGLIFHSTAPVNIGTNLGSLAIFHAKAVGLCQAFIVVLAALGPAHHGPVFLGTGTAFARALSGCRPHSHVLGLARDHCQHGSEKKSFHHD
jgi:hypothetical protein